MQIFSSYRNQSRNVIRLWLTWTVAFVGNWNKWDTLWTITDLVKKAQTMVVKRRISLSTYCFPPKETGWIATSPLLIGYSTMRSWLLGFRDRLNSSDGGIQATRNAVLSSSMRAQANLAPFWASWELNTGPWNFQADAPTWSLQTNATDLENS